MKNCRVQASSPGVPGGGRGKRGLVRVRVRPVRLRVTTRRQRAPGELASRLCVYMYFSN